MIFVMTLVLPCPRDQVAAYASMDVVVTSASTVHVHPPYRLDHMSMEERVQRLLRSLHALCGDEALAAHVAVAGSRSRAMFVVDMAVAAGHAASHARPHSAVLWQDVDAASSRQSTPLLHGHDGGASVGPEVEVIGRAAHDEHLGYNEDDDDVVVNESVVRGGPEHVFVLEPEPQMFVDAVLTAFNGGVDCVTGITEVCVAAVPLTPCYKSTSFAHVAAQPLRHVICRLDRQCGQVWTGSSRRASWTLCRRRWRRFLSAEACSPTR